MFQYLKSKIGPRVEGLTREQVKNFMRFVKDERRLFDLKKTVDEIIDEAIEGKYNYDRF